MKEEEKKPKQIHKTPQKSILKKNPSDALNTAALPPLNYVIFES